MKLDVAEGTYKLVAVEVPETCPNPDCGADLTNEWALKHWEYEDQSRPATWVSDNEDIEWSGDYRPDAGGDCIPAKWDCRACGTNLALGGLGCEVQTRRV